MKNVVTVITLVIVSFSHLAPARGQNYVLGIDSTADAGHLFDANTGALVTSNFLDFASLGSGGSTGKEALQVGNQIWVSDQLRDSIYRFSLNGTHLGTIGNSGLDNIKGMELVGNEVWVTNSGTNNGAPGDAIVRINAGTGMITGSVATPGTLFDLVNYNGLILASNIDTEDLELYNLDGTFNSVFHASDGVTGIDFAQQLFVETNGNVLAAGFSAPSGLYAFDSLGNDLGIIAAQDFGPRGGIRLGNGSLMWTNGSGFFVGSDNSNNVFGGSGQYLTYVNLSVVPEPGALTMVALLGTACLLRRRRAG